MTIHVHLSEEDYIKFNEFHNLNSKAGKKMIWIMRVIVPICFLFLDLMEYLRTMDKMEFIFQLVIAGIFILVWELIVPSVIKKSTRFTIRMIKKDGKLPFHVQAEIEFADDEMIEKSDESIIRKKYEDILNVYEVSDTFYVYIGAIQAWVIPKRCLAEYEGEFRQLMAERCKCGILYKK